VKTETTDSPHLNEVESAIIEIFIRATKILGYPKSIGEIFGLLYISPNPLCMEDIIQKLGISLGAASQGLKILKSMRAVKTNHPIGQRREFYLAETQLDELIGRYLREEFEGHLYSWKNQQDEIRVKLENKSDTNDNHLSERLDNLEALYDKSRATFDLLSNNFNHRKNP